MQLKILQDLRNIQSQLRILDKKISGLDEKLDFSILLQRNHLLRVKNKEELPDEFILQGMPYNDLSPEKAFDLFNNPNLDFIVLDVSKENLSPEGSIEGSIRISLEDLPERFYEITNKTTPILVISEVGIRSIQACEILVKKGHFNINNISGGHKFWPGHRKDKTEKVIA